MNDSPPSSRFPRVLLQAQHWASLSTPDIYSGAKYEHSQQLKFNLFELLPFLVLCLNRKKPRPGMGFLSG